MSIRIHLDQFEGPLGLLLHLIRKNEMDIYDIEISKITQQYLDYIQVMKELDLEVAGEFVSLAAWLINIKSKMLLPQYDAETGEPVQEDPRKELVSRLLEYQQFQEMSKWFKDRHVLGRDTWKRGFREIWTDADGSIILDEGGLYAMIALYRKALKKAQRGVHIVMEKMQSLSQRIMELKELLIPGTTIEMSSLVPTIEWSKTKMVITFMSILELSRLGFTSIYQNDDCGPIHVNTKKAIENDVVSQVQELNAQPLDLEASQTKKFANVFEDEPVAAVMEAATDEDIDLLEKQLEGSSMSALVTDQESAMLVELSEKMETIPEFNQPDEISDVPLSDADVAAVEELVEMEMLEAASSESELPVAAPEPEGPEGDASV